MQRERGVGGGEGGEKWGFELCLCLWRAKLKIFFYVGSASTFYVEAIDRIYYKFNLSTTIKIQ